ncbi:MAG TPA: FkbM family methyltransferase [Roseiflexaceae bacterium]|nr:FkbM family methyltransferase [Roseiflexaceae bacterium]
MAPPSERATVDARLAWAVTRAIVGSAYAYHPDNIDTDRFGRLGGVRGLLQRLGTALRARLRQRGLLWVSRRYASDIYRVDVLSDHFEGLSRVYRMLGDEISRDLLVQLLAYFVLEHERVRLPTNTPAYAANRALVDTLVCGGDSIPVPFLGWKLSLFDLGRIGFPIRLYFVPMGVLSTFIQQQYSCTHSDPPVAAGEGDIVIDAGSCWGDTALYFAQRVGPAGQVYAFEFIPGNLAVLERNLALNPGLAGRVAVVRQPLWSAPGQELAYQDNGPGSQICGQAPPGAAHTAVTTSIDHFVRERGLRRVDFIKMDIEGAELEALRGATETLRAHRPRLALAVYHSMDDLVRIPQFLSDLDLGYRFALGHTTIHNEETILFAAPAAAQG